jgi:hypothetical protein
MKPNLRSPLLALALASGLTGLAAALPSELIGSAHAQPAASSTPVGSCESSAPGTSGPSGCKTGVIHPPATGDKGVVAPPDTSQSMPMPVIPPPGTPGGNPSVQPK